jgi:hypothetical protein
MINFAVFDIDGKITNVIVANSLETAQQAVGTNCVELPEIDFGIGDSYDGTQFIKAPEPEVTND